MAEVSGMWREDLASYFKDYVADDLKKGMAPKTRRAIGLKDDFFYNNAAESNTFRYKIKVKEDQAANATAGVLKKLCTWVEAISSYKRMVEECRNNIQRAFIAQGPFRLAPEWKHLEISEAEWMLKHLSKEEDTYLKLMPLPSRMQPRLLPQVSESVPTVLRAMMNQPSRMMSSLLRKVTESLPMIQSLLIPFVVLKSLDYLPI